MSELKTFPFVVHSVQVSYPERNSRATLGGGWSYTQKPTGKPARTFMVSFEAMKYYLNDNGRLDALTNVETNLKALDDFYAEHEQHAHFIYEHYVYGTVVVVFKTPYQSPKLIPRGDGTSQPFTVELLEIPL